MPTSIIVLNIFNSFIYKAQYGKARHVNEKDLTVSVSL